MVNAKTPYTLQQLSTEFLKSMMANPDVPPSMKDKLKATLELKGSGLVGGLAGVSKASGFVQRMMAENKKKHSGQYKRPTDPPAPDSTMSSWRPFQLHKLANSKQIPKGQNTSKYGASPFILRHFKGVTSPKFKPGENATLPAETEDQRTARMEALAKRLLKLSKKLADKGVPMPTVETATPVAPVAPANTVEARDTIPELNNHFGNVMEGLNVQPKAEPKEEPKPEPKTISGASTFDFEEPKTLSNEYVKRGITGHKWLQKTIAEVMSKHPDYVLQWGTWQIYDYSVFSEGATKDGWLSQSMFPPFGDENRRQNKPWLKKLDIPEGRVNPVSFLKLARSLKERVEKFKEKTPKALRDGGFEVIKKLAGKDGDYPLYPDYLAGKNPHHRQSFPNPETKAYFDEFWDLHEDLYRYMGIQNLLYEVYSKNIQINDVIKRAGLEADGVITDLEQMINALEKVQTKEAIKARMEALRDWNNFHLDWREKWKATKELPIGQPVPHTPDAIGYVINHSEVYRNPNSKLLDFIVGRESKTGKGVEEVIMCGV
jgi:hypothetical protein